MTQKNLAATGRKRGRPPKGDLKPTDGPTVKTDLIQTERRAYRVKEFCEAYRLSNTTVYKLLGEGKLKSVVVAGRRLIPVESAEALFAGGDQ